MQSVTQTERVRTLIRETFTELGAGTDDMRETILVRNGYFCGRRFNCDPFEAVWFFEEDEIKFYGPDGLARKVRPGIMSLGSQNTQRKVA